MLNFLWINKKVQFHDEIRNTFFIEFIILVYFSVILYIFFKYCKFVLLPGNQNQKSKHGLLTVGQSILFIKKKRTMEFFMRMVHTTITFEFSSNLEKGLIICLCYDYLHINLAKQTHHRMTETTDKQ